MSPVMDFGVDFNTAKIEAEKANAPATASVYDLQCRSVTPGKTKKGQSRLQFELVIVNSSDPSANGKVLNYFANCPDNGNFSGVKFLTDICAALGLPWTGTGVDTDAFLGRSARANIGISADGKWNEVISFIS